MSDIKQAIREQYGAVARAGAASQGCCAPSCCAPAVDAEQISSKLGYSDDELGAVPEGANLGLGCGNPQAIAALSPGEVVLDLGSGAGFDAFLAAEQVGATGRVIGVDMTPDMLTRARANAEGRYDNVEFRLGEIEALPVADGTVDVILSNCVINLSPDKGAVFREAFRVLKPSGRLAISDVLARQEIPEALRTDSLIAGCVGGAETVEVVRAHLEAAGFEQIAITAKGDDSFIADWAPEDPSGWIFSANIEAVRP